MRLYEGGEEGHYTSSAINSVPEKFCSPNLTTSGEHSARHQSTTTKKHDSDDFMELDVEFYLKTCVFSGRHKPCYSPRALVASQLARSCDITSRSRGVAEQIEGDSSVDRMFLSNYDMLSEDDQVFDLNNIFGSLQSTIPPVPSPVQKKSPDLEGRSVPEDHFNILPPRPSIMKQTSGIGPARKRKIIDADDETESRVFRRKYLVTEQSEVTNPRVSPSSTVPNSSNGEIDIIDTCETKLDVDEFNLPQGTRPKSQSSLENRLGLHCHNVMLKNLRIGLAAGFRSDVEYEQQEYSNGVGDPYSVAENCEDIYEPEDEVLLKAMGWFVVEEFSNEDNSPNAVRWILDEPPAASDLPHLENLLDISPSKFWSPESETKKRQSARFGYLCSSESPQTSHSIQYFISKSPVSSPDVTGTMLNPARNVRISSKKARHQCSPACPRFHGVAENISTPAIIANKSMKASTFKSPSLGDDRKLAPQVPEGVPDMLPAFLEESFKKNTCTERSMASPVHQETGCGTENAARRLQRGKNLVTDFLKAGTTQEKSEARLVRNDINQSNTTVQPNSTLSRAQLENTTIKTRQKCLTGLSIKGRGISSLSLEPNINLGDENCLMEMDSSVQQLIPSPPEILDQLQGDHNFTRETDGPLVAFSDILNHSNLAKRLRNSLHEKISSQLLFAKPVSESVRNEHLVTVQCPEVTSDNLAWSATGVLRVSRKRSSRIRKPKLKGVDSVLNRFENGEVAQPVRAVTPNKDHCTSTRRKSRLTFRRRTFEELPAFPRSVKLRQIESASSSDCENDPTYMPVQEGRSPSKTPTLTGIVKPLSLIKTSPSEGMLTRVRIKPILKSKVGRGLPTVPRKVKFVQVARNSAVNQPPDVDNAVLTSGKNPRVSGEATRRHEFKEESVSNILADCEISKIPALRSSIYRGVTRHRHTGRYEAHLWDNSRMKLGLAKRGTQVYLGAYSDEDQAAKAHDLATLKYWGPSAFTNFPLGIYEEELRTTENLTKEQFVVMLRRRSSGFTRGVSKYRGVTRHHQEGRWEARIGRHSGAKYQYLGTYETQEEAAAAYDRAAVRHRGIKAITNFDISSYIKKSPKTNKQ